MSHDARLDGARSTFAALASALQATLVGPRQVDIAAYQNEVANVVVPLLEAAVDLADGVVASLEALEARVANHSHVNAP